MPQPEELADQSAPRERQDGPRPGFEDTVWFRMNVGRRQNADARWLLPLLCRRGHITKNEVGAIRINATDTVFEIPRAAAGRFTKALARSGDGEDDGVLIEPVDGKPRDAARENRRAGPNAGRPPARHHAKPFRGAPRPRS
jgi:ATP-dependent RNA helicase DeaD